MASALEQFVNNVRQLSAQGQMTQLCELINKSGELLAKNLSHLDTVLGALDIQEHSLGVLAVLFVKFSMPNIPDFETLFSQVQLFISTCNGEHIRYATDTFAGLCHQLTSALVERKQASVSWSFWSGYLHMIKLTLSFLSLYSLCVE
ncbi:hypothetical protein cypCar_00014260 [Cyprinus carpio]|nr:hypothetical protein cypCar_00014260 [Cyprinus carpio]